MRRSSTLRLRVGRARWADFFVREFRQVEDVHSKYEQAEACVVTVSAPGLGAASIQCERAFTPLRWAFGRDDEGPYVVLVDNTDGKTLTTTRFDFSTPDQGRIVSIEAGRPLRWPEGGLAHATDGMIQASVVLPPLVRTLEDLHRMREPELGHLGRTRRDVLRVIELSQLWAAASLPADPFAAVRRLVVQRAIARAVVSTIGGERWTKAELVARDGASDLRLLGEAIGDKAEHRELAGTLRSEMPTLERLDLEGRIAHFGAILRVHGHAAPEDQDVVSEFLLRLATEPSTLLGWHAGNTDHLLSLALSSPVVLRAARFIVLATATGPEDAGSVYPGWSWE